MIFAHLPPEIICKILTYINSPIVQFISREWQTFSPTNKKWLCDAAAIGHFDVIKWANVMGCYWPYDICEAATRANRPDILKYILEHGGKVNYIEGGIAAARGYIEILKILWKFDACDTGLISRKAAEHGRIAVFEWLRDVYPKWKSNTCTTAAEYGRVKLLKWLRENDCPWDEDTISIAAYCNRYKTVKYLCKNSCPWNENTCRRAVLGGNFWLFKYLHEHGCPWDTRTCSAAIRMERLDILQYAWKNGCPYREEICVEAIMMSNFAILNWLVENGAVVTDTAHAAATYNNNEQIRGLSPKLYNMISVYITTPYYF